MRTSLPKQARRTVPIVRYGAPEERHAGAYLLWKRLRDSKDRDHWLMMVKLGANESFGSQLGLLFMGGKLSEFQAEAGRFFAIECARHDHYFNVSRRDVVSPAYEKGAINSRNDEEALARLQGSIDDYERRCKRIRKRWHRIESAVGNKAAIDLLYAVCVHDRPCPASQIKLLGVALELIVRKFHMNTVRPEEVSRVQQKRRRRRNGRAEPSRQSAEYSSKVGNQ